MRSHKKNEISGEVFLSDGIVDKVDVKESRFV